MNSLVPMIAFGGCQVPTRPTLFFSVPTLYAHMLQEAERESYCLDSVRLAVSAAEPLPAEMFRRWQRKFGVEILDGIGSTEVLHMYLSARPGNVKPGSTGSAVPGYKLRIVDSDDREVPPGSIGDLLVAGDSIALCYWNRRQLTAERMRGKWFFTGDKYWMDKDGYHWYAGRSDDMFVAKMNEALDDVRAAEARKMKQDGHEPLLKESRWCILKRKANLNSQQKFRLSDLLRYNQQTVRAYLERVS